MNRIMADETPGGPAGRRAAADGGGGGAAADGEASDGGAEGNAAMRLIEAVIQTAADKLGVSVRAAPRARTRCAAARGSVARCGGGPPASPGVQGALGEGRQREYLVGSRVGGGGIRAEEGV